MTGSCYIQFVINGIHDDMGRVPHTWPHCGKNGGSYNE